MATVLYNVYGPEDTDPVVDRVLDMYKKGSSQFVVLSPAPAAANEILDASTQRVYVFSLMSASGEPLEFKSSRFKDGPWLFTGQGTKYEVVSTSPLPVGYDKRILLRWSTAEGLAVHQIQGFTSLQALGNAHGTVTASSGLAACTFNAAGTSLCGRK